MINLAIAGAAGRMGCSIIRTIQNDPELKIVSAYEYPGSNAIGKDAGTNAGCDSLDVAISDSFNASKCDVIIDFTTPDSTLNNIQLARQQQTAILIGTTGLTEEQKQVVQNASNDIPVLLAANTSVGVNLCISLLQIAAKSLVGDFDIEIIEAHHRHKVDAPSGTALLMGESIASVLDKDLAQDGVFERYGQTGARKDGTIGFSTIRGGDVAGEHTVMFIGDSERIEITHKATDRQIFAKGAVRAAIWLAGQQKGFYNMQDVLGLR